MSARIIDGKAIAASIRAQIADRTSAFRAETGIVPQLAAVLVGDNPASEVYVRNKRKACEGCGIASSLHRLAGDASQSELLDLVAMLNADPDVHGILVQLPLPPQISENAVLDAVDPLKDVDAFHPQNVGLIVQGRPRYLPCTPHGCQRLLQAVGTPGRMPSCSVAARSSASRWLCC